MGRAGCDGWRAELERPPIVIYIVSAGSEGKRIGQRSDSKSDVQKWIVGSNPMPSALSSLIVICDRFLRGRLLWRPRPVVVIDRTPTFPGSSAWEMFFSAPRAFSAANRAPRCGSPPVW